MADAFDLFRSLSAGAKFDHKRFKEDWEKFKVRYLWLVAQFRVYSVEISQLITSGKTVATWASLLSYLCL